MISSFRDPDGRVVLDDGRIVRVVHAHAAAAFDALLQTPFIRQAVADGLVVRTSPAESALARRVTLPGEDHARVVEHERVPFVSYPSEWPAEMLHAAAALTLELAVGAAAAGWELKDATPFNVLFRGPVPVFVDLLSFRRRDASNPIWWARGQFDRTFLLPLLQHRLLGTPPHRAFALSREGVAPEDLAPLLHFRDRFRPRVQRLVLLPARIEGRRTSYAPRPMPAEQAGFVYGRLLRLAQRDLAAVAPRSRASTWTGYLEEGPHAEAYHARKQAWCAAAVERCRPRWVLDLGCNTGALSETAARAGAQVVAVDSDDAVVGLLWRRARAEGLPVLPLRIDLLAPTPAFGWRNGEGESFLDRCRGRFDLVFAFAVLHWLGIVGQVPLGDIVALLAEMTTDRAVVEWIPAEDAQVRRMLARFPSAAARWTREALQRAIEPHFEVEEDLRLDGSDRSLLLLRRRRA